MRLREKTDRLEVVLTLLLIQLILLPAALGVTYASSGTRPEHILTYTTGRLTWDSATETARGPPQATRTIDQPRAVRAGDAPDTARCLE